MKRTQKRHVLSRRNFLGSAAAALAAPLVIPGSALGKNGAVAPSNTLRMGCIGLGGMGTHDMINFMKQPDLKVVAVCDVNAACRESACRQTGLAAKDAYNEFEAVLQRDDIDVVTIGTPDHWHTLIAVAAAKAGKDIYCEKPMSLTIEEGRITADTMRRYGRVYQSGTQRRNVNSYMFPVRMARQGKLGAVHTIRAMLDRGHACGPQPIEPVPAGFDYDRWLGQAPPAPYTTQRLRQWRYVYDYAGGNMTDMGAHYADLAQLAHDSELTGPTEYEGSGTFPTDGLFNTPVDYEVTATYPDGVKLVLTSQGRGMRIEGDEGWIFIDDLTANLDAEPKSLLKEIDFIPQRYSYMIDHHRNFLDCVKSRRRPSAPPEIAHRSVTICHAAVICLRMGGGKLKWDPAKEQFVGNDAANRMLSRTMRAPWTL